MSFWKNNTIYIGSRDNGIPSPMRQNKEIESLVCGRKQNRKKGSRSAMRQASTCASSTCRWCWLVGKEHNTSTIAGIVVVQLPPVLGCPLIDVRYGGPAHTNTLLDQSHEEKWVAGNGSFMVSYVSTERACTTVYYANNTQCWLSDGHTRLSVNGWALSHAKICNVSAGLILPKFWARIKVSHWNSRDA